MTEQEPIPGVLVSGILEHETQPLTVGEYWALKTCLDFYRSDDKNLNAIASAVRSCSNQWGNGQHYELGWFLRGLYGDLGVDSGEFDGMLTQGFDPPLLLQDTNRDAKFDESESLAAFLMVLRAGGWLAEWLDTQVRCFADRKSNPPPTPTLLMSLLTIAAAEFEVKLNNARHVLNNHWESLGFSGTKPPDPAAYQAPKPPTPAERVTDPRMFQLTMVDGGDVKEPANLTRREFQELKKHLASMRARKSGKGKKAA